MRQKIELNLEKRSVLGKKVRGLRESGIIPGILYGHGFESMPIQVDRKNFDRVFKEAGESSLVYVNINGQSYPTIIHDVAVDSVNDIVDHVDFYKVRLDEKITAKVPIVMIGESPAVKNFGGIVIQNVNEIEVEALPQNLPHQIEADISTLAELRASITVNDLHIPENVEVKANPDETVILVQEPISEEKLEEELSAPTAAPEEVEVGEKKEPAEGEEIPEAETGETKPSEEKKEEK